MNTKNTSGSLVGPVVLAGGALATALGLTVLVGWYTHLPVLVRVSPGFFPMPANAALGFLLCGAALVALHRRRPGVAIASGLVTVALGLATLAEYAFDWSPGLDQLLLQHYITFGTSPPGRMAPNGALCLVLTGAALLLAGAGPRFRHSSSGLGLLGAVVCALGMTALASCVAGLSTYAWWPLTRMAAHASVGYVVLGLAVMALGWQRSEQGYGGPRRWLPLSVGIFAVTVTLCPWQALEAMPGASRKRADALAAQLAPSADRVKVTSELLKDEMTALPEVALGTGLVMSLLLALAVYWAQAARRRAQAAEAARRHLEQEVGQRQQAEEALRQADDQLEQRVRERTAELEQANRQLQVEISTRQRVQEDRDRFFTLSRDMLCVCDFEGWLQSVNPAWERTLGCAETELKAQSVVDFVHPDDREATLREIQKLASGAEAKLFQNRYRARDGSYRWFLWNAVPIPERKQIYAAARDITELKQAEERLREREERFRKIFEDAPIGISIVGADRRFARVNRALAEMLGYAGQELLGLTFGDITHPEDLARDVDLADQLFAGRIPGYRLAERYLKKSGEVLWVDLTATIIRADDGEPLCGVNMVENIQERKQREEEIRQLNAELEQRVTELTAVNQELEAFTYSVSHDLRAPLRHIDGFSKILAEEAGAGLDPSAKECLEHIRKGSQQAGRMVDELLNLARIVRPEASRELTGLGSLVEEVLSDLEPEMEGREITLEIGELPLVDCDPVLMKQVFVNLFSNALKFTRPRPRAVIQVGQIRQAGQAVVFVRDNGVGFSMKYADKLFGVFQRLHRREEFEGTGIGLATVQRIIQKHGGRVWAEAELDRGATFFFTLDPKEGQPAQDRIIAIA